MREVCAQWVVWCCAWQCVTACAPQYIYAELHDWQLWIDPKGSPRPKRRTGLDSHCHGKDRSVAQLAINWSLKGTGSIILSATSFMWWDWVQTLTIETADINNKEWCVSTSSFALRVISEMWDLVSVTVTWLKKQSLSLAVTSACQITSRNQLSWRCFTPYLKPLN